MTGFVLFALLLMSYGVFFIAVYAKEEKRARLKEIRRLNAGLERMNSDLFDEMRNSEWDEYCNTSPDQLMTCFWRKVNKRVREGLK
jgi:hypothetical protein